jgi:hypothetical protein
VTKTSSARLGLFAIAMTAACDWGPQYCEGDWAASSEADAPPTPARRTVAQVLPAESTAVDILFVIDDSRSMTDEQKQLGIWSNELFDVLSDDGELPDLHIAVTSSSLAIDGLTQCQTTGGLHVGSAALQSGKYLTDVAGPSGRVRNYTGTLTDTFAKMALVGDSGCGFEQPFKAARNTLSGYVDGSKGFLRDDALLLVVFVTDEDDCSSNAALFSDSWGDACSEMGTLTDYRCFEFGARCYDGKGSREFGERYNCHPDETSLYLDQVSAFARYLEGLKKDPAQVIVAGIYGKPNGVRVIADERFTTYQTPRLADVCGGTGDIGTGATPGIRINALLAEFGGRASQSSICEQELSWAMRDMGLVTRDAATRSHCLRGAIKDSDTVAQGIQPACRVEAARDPRTTHERRFYIPPCDRASSGARCFTIDSDPACENESDLAVHIHDGDESETLIVSCDVELDWHPPRPSIGETRAIE